MAFQPQPQRSGLVGVLDPGLISALSDSSVPRACFTPQARAPLWLWVQASSQPPGLLLGAELHTDACPASLGSAFALFV